MQEQRFAPARWDLTDVLPSAGGREYSAVLSQIEERAKRFEAFRARLPSFGKDDVEGALVESEGLQALTNRAASYAELWFSTDTANQEAKSMVDKTEELAADVENRTLFFRLWWIALDDERAKALEPSDPDHAYYLDSVRKLKPHTLEEKVEQAVNLKNTTGFSGWTHHYDQIVSEFTYTVKVRGKAVRGKDGKPKKFMTSELVRLVTSPDAAQREGAYTTLLRKYGEYGGLLGEVYRTIARDWRNEFVKLRGYSSPIAARNLENDVSDRAVETLLASCRSNAPVFQDFFAAKAKMLGMKRLRRYDIYAPLGRKERTVRYGDAVATVMKAFTEFDPGFAGMARRVFEEGHVDSMPRAGKRGGAYCASITPETVPYLFMSYTGANRDVYTIAHESGHAVHSQLASGHSVLTFHPPLVLAETASVFGEMMLFDALMKDEKDAEVRKAVLLEKISSMYSTIGRQAYFVVFENEAHAKVDGGATVSDLSAAYLANLKEQFGSAVEVPEEFKWEWTYIPHIYHTPFYCYAYAFGNLLSLALYDMYTKEGKGFVPKYLRVLSYGGSASPARILSEVGVDIESRPFWQSGFDVITRMVSELRKM